jgi:hypothetical protein
VRRIFDMIHTGHRGLGLHALFYWYLLLLLSIGGRAQSIQLLPLPPSGKASASFQIMLVSAAAKQPVALQWKISLPAGVSLEANDIAIASAAESAQKTISCAKLGEKEQKGEGSANSSVLAGARRPPVC